MPSPIPVPLVSRLQRLSMTLSSAFAETITFTRCSKLAGRSINTLSDNCYMAKYTLLDIQYTLLIYRVLACSTPAELLSAHARSYPRSFPAETDLSSHTMASPPLPNGNYSVILSTACPGFSASDDAVSVPSRMAAMLFALRLASRYIINSEYVFGMTRMSLSTLKV